jgi:nucleoid-associated protein YgaU
MASLEQLKAKYQSVIDLAKNRGAKLKNVHVENEKLLIRADVPNQDVKNELWDRIKAVDARYADLTADINVDASLPAPAKAAQTHVVAAGDTLSKLAKKFYGDANQYMKIFEANKDQLKDPDKINVGQKLKIPQ